ncbi:hypothetical protein [Marinoscillum pacificum]|uniref:hypothetical protein n=1 Tax=Marinoscillum pacificum TaxID=392723 RepID=UPI00215895D5|nr:hypothetical protein [Marinoscillum pacificum]
MKTKIYLVVLALAMMACGGEKKSETETPDVDELVEMAVDSTEAEIDTMMVEVDTVTDSLEAEIDSVTSEAP